MRSRGCHFSTAVLMAVMCLVGADLPSCERAKCHHCRVDFIAKMCPTTCEPCPKPIPRPSSGRFAQAKRIVLAATATAQSIGNEQNKKLLPLPHRNIAHETNGVSPQPLSIAQPHLVNATTQTPQPQFPQRVNSVVDAQAAAYTTSSTAPTARYYASQQQPSNNHQKQRSQSSSSHPPSAKVDHSPTLQGVQPQAQLHQRPHQQRLKQQAAPTQQYPQLVSAQNLQQPQSQPQPQPQFQQQPESQLQAQLQPSPQSAQFAQYQPQQAPPTQFSGSGIQQPYQFNAPAPQSPAFNPFQPFLSQSFNVLPAATPAPIFNPFTFPTFAPMTFPPMTPPPQRAFQPIRFSQVPTLLPPPMPLANFGQSQLSIPQPQIPPPPPPPLSLLSQIPTTQDRYAPQQIQPQRQSQSQQSYFPKQQVQQPNYAQVNYQQQVAMPQPTSQIAQQRQQPPAVYQPQPAIVNPTQYAINQNAATAPKTSEPEHFPQPPQVIVTQPPLPQPQPVAAPAVASIDATNTHIQKTFYATGKEVPTPITQCPRQPNWEPCISKEVANERFRNCCQRLGEGCAALCNYDATLATIQLGVLTGRCPISKVADMMICASGYEDATPCCQAFNVFEPGFEHCQPYCNPAAGLPQGGMLSEQYKCLGKLSQIQRCFYISQRP